MLSFVLPLGHLSQYKKHHHPLVNSEGTGHPDRSAGLCRLSGDYRQGLGAGLGRDTLCASVMITTSRSGPREAGTCFRSHRHCLNCSLNQHWVEGSAATGSPADRAARWWYSLLPTPTTCFLNKIRVLCCKLRRVVTQSNLLMYLWVRFPLFPVFLFLFLFFFFCWIIIDLERVFNRRKGYFTGINFCIKCALGWMPKHLISLPSVPAEHNLRFIDFFFFFNCSLSQGQDFQQKKHLFSSNGIIIFA